jgi:hypothetical protein
MRSSWKYVKWSEDPTILAKNKQDSEMRTNSTTIGGGGLEWGAWFQFIDEHDQLRPSTLALLADIFRNMPQLIPGYVTGDLDALYVSLWFIYSWSCHIFFLS